MQSTTLRALLRARAPRRFASTSSSSEAAQKKAQEALGAASAAAVRAGEYARSALGPFGARLSGLLGCPYPFLSLPSLNPPN
jgi:F-type H+-transporting ATPase subunit g